MSKILVVEDDLGMREELVTLLENNGYEVLTVDDFGGVVEEIIGSVADLVLLDINIPGMNGEIVLRKVREKSMVPVVMVTGKDTEMDEALSMSYGADDFVTKPYNPNILLLRIEAVLRRAAGVTGQEIKFHGLKYFPERGEIEGVMLTKNERLVFNYLLDNKERIVSRKEMMTLLWDNASFLNDATLSVTVSRLRDKLEKLGLKEVIETRRGQGYILR